MTTCGTSLFAGLSPTVLQANLAAAQQAYAELSTGAKIISASYTQGDGAKSVTYRQANIAEVAALIRQLQQELGIVSRARRPAYVRF